MIKNESFVRLPRPHARRGHGPPQGHGDRLQLHGRAGGLLRLRREGGARRVPRYVFFLIPSSNGCFLIVIVIIIVV